MKIQNFEDILSWQKAQQLSIFIYALFRSNKDYGFKDQIQRATISISNNIAEGYERKSNNEFKHFLYIAKGSCGELRSMSYIARKLKYVSEDDFKIISEKAKEISRLLSGLIKAL